VSLAVGVGARSAAMEGNPGGPGGGRSRQREMLWMRELSSTIGESRRGGAWRPDGVALPAGEAASSPSRSREVASAGLVLCASGDGR
jgi:hypothetical protein